MEKENKKISNGVNDISREAFKKIKEKMIKPKPRWEFILKEYVIWLFASVSFLVGSLAVAVIIYMLRNNDWDLSRQASHSLIGFIFATLPYFWISFLILFGLFTYYNFKHTKGGYRYALSYILLGIVLISLFLGIAFYNIGLGRAMDRIFFNRMPFYERLMSHRQNIWLKPSQGLLPGKIISEVVDDEFELSGLDKKIWLIKKQKALVAPMVILRPGEPIKIIGEQVGGSVFQAREIRPLLLHKRPGFKRRRF